MIADRLMEAFRLARHAAHAAPDLFPAALDRVTDQVDRLLELQGEAARPLRDCGYRMARLIWEMERGGDRAELLVRFREEAIIAMRLERVVPLRGGVGPHMLPQLMPGRARNVPFTVVRGGRA